MLVSLLAVQLLGGALQTNAAMPDHAVDADPDPLGITVSGGVSLGTWEAGFIYLYLEALKIKPEAQVRVVTGASAGSANALITAISSCRLPEPFPMSSLGWKVWGPIGFKELFDRRRSTYESLFVRDALDASFERVHTVWREGLPTSCDVVVGTTVTRVQPREAKLQDGLSVPRVLETFTIRIQGRGPGKSPRLSNYVSPTSPMPQPLLPFVDDENDPVASDRNFLQLRSLIFASGAFPVAFSPQPISYCLSKSVAPGEALTAEAIACPAPQFVDLFVDGGVFDNNPLRLAWSVAEQSLRRTPEGRTYWADLLKPLPETGHPAVRYLYLDPDLTVFPTEKETSPNSKDNGFISKLFNFTNGFIESARARELLQLARERAGVSDRVHLAMSSLPKASEPLQAFAGFFETDFRRFDFYLGMYDAFAELANAGTWRKDPINLEMLLATSDEARREWSPFVCMLSMMRPRYASYQNICTGPELANFRVLLQTSIDRLYDACRPNQNRVSQGAGRYHHLCEDALQGHEPAAVPGQKQLAPQTRRRRSGEDDFDYFMRLLGAYGFHFVDLGLRPNESTYGAHALRQQLDDVVDEWASAQPSFADRTFARIAGRTALNLIDFSPPQVSGYFTLGTTLEAGVSFTPGRWKPRWLQLNGALTFNNLFTLITEPRPRFTANFTAGPEFHLSIISNAIAQPRLALRGGIQLGLADRFATQGCIDIDPRSCTQAIVEASAAVALFERLRVELVWQTYPRLYGHGTFSALQLGVGVHFY